MLQRAAMVVITLFWVVMNVLLWRSEYGSRNHLGSTVPFSVVWQKMLTAPDNSSMEVDHHGQRIGYCRWTTIAGRNASRKWFSPDAPPDQALETVSDYEIDFEGNLLVGGPTNRLRFDFSIRFDTNHVWQDLRLRLNLRPNIWEIRSRASEQSIHLRMQDQEGISDRTIAFASLTDPAALAGEFGIGSLGALEALGLPEHSQTNSPMPKLGLKWEARNDWMRIGHTAVRAYRLQARLLERYEIVVIVSRVGEILRVELPDQLVLTNDQLN